MTIKPLNLRIQNLLNEIKIDPKITHYSNSSKQQTINQPIVKLELTKLSKTKIHLITFQKTILNIQNNYLDHHIYTDWSKQRMKVGCAAILWNQELLKCLPNESSIYSAEVATIDLAMNIIANHKSSKLLLHLLRLQISSLSSTEQRYFNPSHHKTPKQNKHSF